MRTDAEICKDVIEELRWARCVDEIDIAVKVIDGVVALSGFVKSFDERCGAERAVKRVSGVRALANDLEIRLPAVRAGVIRTSRERPLRHSSMNCPTRRSSSASWWTKAV